MGVFGLAPWDSDDYGELNDSLKIGELLDGKVNHILGRARRASPSEKWAAIGVAIVAWHSTYLDMDQQFKVAEQAQALWEDLFRDREWLQSWREPKAFRKMFTVVGSELEDMVNSYGKYRPQAKASPIVLELFAEYEKKGRR